MSYAEFSEKGITLSIKVIPNSSKNELIKDADRIRLKITAPPVDNKANKFVVEYLAKYFKIPKTSIQIVRGTTSREKTILLGIQDKDKRDFIKDLLKSLQA